MLNWADRFNIFCFLDNHHYEGAGHQQECLLAAGVRHLVQPPVDIVDIDKFLEGKDWVFCHLSYELKNRFFTLPVARPDPVGFPLFCFFEPMVVISLTKGGLLVEADDPATVLKEIMNMVPPPDNNHAVVLQQRFHREEYLNTVKKIKDHIRRGDCYELNFCTEFFATGVRIQPLEVYDALVAHSPAPFSALYKWEHCYALCASPERFLQKVDGRIIAQPMKGTAPRLQDDPPADEQAAQSLQNDPKEQAENVMIVDLMRNDLSRICKDGSVKVSELFGVYSFPAVHQMVSTVEGMLRDDVRFSHILEATFPMGSMTGAPKQRVLELIDAFEKGPRGLFSGSIGYFHGSGFDLNVVIRSIFYNSKTGYLSYQAGSGITHYSDPEKEWEECLWKGAAIKKVLTEGPALI